MSHISPENEQFIQHELELGEYRNREELLDRAVGLLKRRRELQTDIQSGIDSGVSVPAQEVFARLEKRAQELGGGAQGIFRWRLGDLLPAGRQERSN